MLLDEVEESTVHGGDGQVYMWIQRGDRCSLSLKQVPKAQGRLAGCDRVAYVPGGKG